MNYDITAIISAIGRFIIHCQTILYTQHNNYGYHFPDFSHCAVLNLKATVTFQPFTGHSIMRINTSPHLKFKCNHSD